jgi:hypothetical protein
MQMKSLRQLEVEIFSSSIFQANPAVWDKSICIGKSQEGLSYMTLVS